MKTGRKEELIRYRLERARQTFESGRLLAEAEDWHSSLNRLYYACFYAVSALLLRHDLSSSKHTGVRSFFNRHFVKTGKVSEELGDLYNDLFADRQSGDYEDLRCFEEAQVRPRIAAVERFLRQIEKLSRTETSPEEPPSGTQDGTV